MELFLCSDPFICSALTFPQSQNPDHVFVSVSLDFSLNSKEDVCFHCTSFVYSPADWDGLIFYHLSDITYEDNFGDSAPTSLFCEWKQVGADVYIPQ